MSWWPLAPQLCPHCDLKFDFTSDLGSNVKGYVHIGLDKICYKKAGYSASSYRISGLLNLETVEPGVPEDECDWYED